jgi:hypothetical protein
MPKEEKKPEEKVERHGATALDGKGRNQHHEEGGKKEGAGKKKKLHLHQIITTRAHDGSFGHEHVYKEHPEDPHSRPPVFAGTSQDMDDLHQHMDDHFGGGAEEGAPGGEEAEAGAPPAAGGAPGPENA